MEHIRDRLLQQLQEDDGDLQDESTQVYDVGSMPGFRFQPTEEELVGFYLRSMVVGNRLEVELINVLDLYSYDPWELPAMAFMQGEREWLFFCPRDRKYPNGARPNRVTASGYWKATGTDRQVRRALDARCIGFKKTLVFYTGKAPRGRKTEWIMNEYRLLQEEQIVRRSSALRDPREVALCRIYRKPVVQNSSAQVDSNTEDIGLESSTHSPYESSQRRESGGPESEQASASTSGTSPISTADTLAMFRRRSILEDTDMLCDTQATGSHHIQASCSRSVKQESEPSLTSSVSRYTPSLAPDNVDSIDALLSAQLMEVHARRGRSIFDDSPSETRVTDPSELGVSASTSVDRLSWFSPDEDSCAHEALPEESDVADLMDQPGCSNLSSQFPSIDRLWSLKASLWSPLASTSIFAVKDDDDDLPVPGSLFASNLGWSSQPAWLSTISPVRPSLLQFQGHSFTSSE